MSLKPHHVSPMGRRGSKNAKNPHVINGRSLSDYILREYVFAKLAFVRNSRVPSLVLLCLGPIEKQERSNYFGYLVET